MTKLESHQQQTLADGCGPYFHRIFRVSLPIDFSTAKKAMRDLQIDINRFSPQVLARFEKLTTKNKSLKVGDEFQIHITGPWDGPVKVNHVCEESFCLVTLEGHFEAGRITFYIKENTATETLFEIESMARSRDKVVDFVYDKLPIAKIAQTEMWTSYCQSFADYICETYGADKDKIGDVEVVTERKDEETGVWQTI